MMKVLEGEEIDAPTLSKAIRTATLTSRFFPAFCGTAFKNKGVKTLLDGVVSFLPSPIDVPAIKGTLPNGDETEKKSSDDESFSALAFRIMTDTFVGKLTFFRVYSGVFERCSSVFNASKNNKERI